MERHAVLRARFRMEDGRPVQTFHEQRGADLPLVDLTHLPESERPSEMEHALHARARRALDLEKDPLLQAQLFRLSDDRHELALTFHEIILDLWALSIMMRDLAVIYRGLVGGHGAAPLRRDLNAAVKPDVQFGDYAVWEGENVLRERLLPQEEYWRRQLAGELPVLDVPTDRPRPAVPTYRGRAKTVMLDAELSHQLRALSRQEEATLFMTLLAASSTLLHVYSGQDDLIIGAPIANRGRSETESIVGFFLNMLPLRTRPSGGTSFRDLLRQVRRTAQGALSNAEYPFVSMLEKVRVARDTSVAPVFQVMFNMLNLPYASLEEAGLRIAFSEVDTGYVKYDLALYAQEHGDRIFFQIAYLIDLFDDATIERMLANFQVLLRSIVTDPDARLADLKVLREDERRTLLVDFCGTDRDFGNECCLHELFEEQVRRTPDATALLFGDERLGYAALNAKANRLARHLRRQGVGRETPVAVCTERSFDTLVALLGVMKAGGAYVALEPAYPLLRLQEMLEDTRPPVLVAQRRLDRFEGFGGVRIWLDEHRDGIEAESADDLPGLTRPDDLLNIVYTSSSTGRPKGALITGRAVLNRLFWMWETHPFREGDCRRAPEVLRPGGRHLGMLRGPAEGRSHRDTIPGRGLGSRRTVAAAPEGSRLAPAGVSAVSRAAARRDRRAPRPKPRPPPGDHQHLAHLPRPCVALAKDLPRSALAQPLRLDGVYIQRHRVRHQRDGGVGATRSRRPTPPQHQGLRPRRAPQSGAHRGDRGDVRGRRVPRPWLPESTRVDRGAIRVESLFRTPGRPALPDGRSSPLPL